MNLIQSKPTCGHLYRLFCLAILSALSINSIISVSAQPTYPFELGGQILTFLHPYEMHGATMTWLKMQITYNRGAGGSTADAVNVITHARNHGFKVLLSIKGIQSELASNPTQYYQDFAGFLARVALLAPEAIEVWNEPNIDQEWPAGLISGTAYAQMLARAYPSIKGANANVMVISGAPAPTGFFGGVCTATGCDDNVFIQQMAAAGAAQNFDCTGIHYNEGVVPPTASSGDPRGNPNHYTRYYSTMVALYRSVFPTKPLCFTELGYLTPDGLGSLPPGLEWAGNTSAQEQADWLAQAALLSRGSGIVRLMFVWNVDAPFMPSEPMAGWAMIRTGGQCLPCGTLWRAFALPPTINYRTASTVPLRWTAITWAVNYEIQVDDSTAFAGSLEYQTTIPAVTLTITTPTLAKGTHYWRVRAQQANGTWGAWSVVNTFQVAV
jgi:hypothetical protein